MELLLREGADPNLTHTVCGLMLSLYLLHVLLTLGAHAPEGNGSCPVCVSVRNLNLGTGASRGLNEGTSE